MDSKYCPGRKRAIQDKIYMGKDLKKVDFKSFDKNSDIVIFIEGLMEIDYVENSFR
jgi:hypothetical protein